MSDRTPSSPLHDERAAAEYITYTPAALRLWRRQGRGPVYLKIGRSIRYRTADLDTWLAAHRVEPMAAVRK